MADGTSWPASLPVVAVLVTALVVAGTVLRVPPWATGPCDDGNLDVDVVADARVEATADAPGHVVVRWDDAATPTACVADRLRVRVRGAPVAVDGTDPRSTAILDTPGDSVRFRERTAGANRTVRVLVTARRGDVSTVVLATNVTI